MKKLSMIALVVLCVAFAGLAEAAPKKRTRNQNRIGPYGAVLLGQTSYTGDQSGNEQTLLDIIDGNNIPLDVTTLKTEDSDFGYQLAFGYRFHRYFAAEIALAQFGQLSSKASGELDDGTGPVPSSAELTFDVGGPVFSAIGILPMGKQLEGYARVGYLFASAKREFSLRVDGQSAGTLNAKGDSQTVVYGLGLAWNVNQVYTVRAEYQKLNDVGQSGRTGSEDMETLNIGLMMRF